MQQTNWKQFRPELHKKTFFKGATSLTMGMEGSLNLYDDTARELVKHAYRITKQEMPEQSLEDRLRETAHRQGPIKDFLALEDLSDSEHEDGANQKNSSNLNSTKDLSSSKLFSSGATAAGTSGTLPAQGSKTMNSKAQLIDKSLANNANLVKVMDQKLINNRTRAMH